MKIYYKIILDICIVILAFISGGFYAVKINENNNMNYDTDIRNQECNCNEICDNLLKQMLNNKILDRINENNSRVEEIIDEKDNINIENNIEQSKAESNEDMLNEISPDDLIATDNKNNLHNDIDNMQIMELHTDDTNNNDLNNSVDTNIDEIENVDDIIGVTNDVFNDNNDDLNSIFSED